MNKLGASVLHPMELFKSGTSILLVAIQLSFSLFLSDRPAPGPHPDRSAAPSALYPLPRFEKNLGQAGSDADFLCRGRNHLLLLGPAGSSLHLLDTSTGDSFIPLRMQVAGARTGSRGKGVNELRSKSNYYIGNDPNSWRTGVPHYERVEYADLYPGIDMTYYFRGQEVEFDFIVAPGADGGAIRLSFAGADKLVTDEEGHLSIHAQGEQLVYHKPLAWQQRAGRKQPVEVQFALLDEKSIGFDIASYDRRAELVIDPQIVYATYLGGSDTDTGNGIAVDADGCAYVTGSTVSVNFPTQNAFQGALTPGMFSNLSDVIISKLSADGRDLLYSTYLGGRWDDRGAAIAVDASGRACVTGQTSSDDDAGKPGYQGFPLQRAFQETIGGPNFPDAFVTVLNPYGDLYYSTYLGGEYEDAGTDIAIGADGSLYITGKEFSFDFPVKNAYLEKKPGYYFDAFVTKIDPAKSGAASLIYSTHLGGTADTYGNAIAVDGRGCAYVTGKTSAADFPTLHAIQPAYQGKGDIFVSKFDPANSGAASLIYSTFLGDAVSNEGLGIAVDAHGCAVVSGYGPVPVTSGAFTTPGSAFISKLNAAGTGFLWSARPYNARKLALDPDGNVYTNSSYLYPGAGAGVMALKADGTDTLYTSRIVVVPQDVAVSGSGDVYAAGTTTLEDFPVVNPFQPSLAGKSDLFIVKMAGTVRKTLAVTPDPVYFPLTLPGEIARKSVEIASSGGAAVEIGNIEVEPAALFALENAPALPLTLKPGEKVEFQIAYAPPAALKKAFNPAETGAMTVTSNADEPITTVSLFTAGIIVNNTGDASDYDLNDGICDTDPDQPGNQCTLRAAIQNVNALQSTIPTTVYFRIPGSAPFEIKPLGALPAIDYPLLFDILSAHAPVVLNGEKAGEADGLIIHAGNSLICDIILEKWRGNGLHIKGGNGNTIERCVMRANGYPQKERRAGILIEESSSNEVRKNKIFSNIGVGIHIHGESSQLNHIFDNRIGYNQFGTAGASVQASGIAILQGCNNKIQNNEIGSNLYGITIESVNSLSGKAAGNLIQSNQIGSDTSGKVNYGNFIFGILIKGAHETVIDGNLISWNGNESLPFCGGLKVADDARDTQVINNIIGPDSSGLVSDMDVGNKGDGVIIANGASYTRLRNNLISANHRYGIRIGEEDHSKQNGVVHHTTIENNVIGLDRNRDEVMGNGGSGILVYEQSYATSIQSNVISGNSASGVYITTGKAIHANIIGDNKIGTDGSGTKPAPNSSGIYVSYSSNLLILGNTISGNTEKQIGISDPTPGVCAIMNNNIGPAVTGEALAWNSNSEVGIQLSEASATIDENQIAFNMIGIECKSHTDAKITNNMIHHNELGVKIRQSPATIIQNAIFENYRGIDVDNREAGKAVIASNEIFDNFGSNSGIHLIFANAAIYGNYIHHDTGDGITIAGGGSPLIQKNNIMDNQGFGVRHTGSSASVDARYNYWNDASGPGGAGPGSGDRVSAGIDYTGWRKEAVSLFVCPERDTLVLKTGKQDQITLFFQNWSWAGDVVEHTVHADKDWVVPKQTRMIGLGQAWGASDQVDFFVPASTPQGSTARVEVRAISTINPAYRDTARFVVIAGSMALHRVIVLPDSVMVARGDSVLFTAQGYDQFAGALAVQPLWQCTGGTVDRSGLFVAGQTTGLYQVTVSDSSSGLSSRAKVLVGEETGVTDRDDIQPMRFYVSQNYPNPFNQTTRLDFMLPRPSKIQIDIINVRGRKVRRLLDEYQPAGNYSVQWDGYDDQGGAVAGGLYICRFNAPGFVESRKMVLLR